MIQIKPLSTIMDITSTPHHQTQTDLSTTTATPTTSETKLTKIPKPFSIESLISSTRRTDTTTTTTIRPTIDEQHHNNLDNNSQQIFSQQQNLSTTNNFIPNFPIYNPWMGYLSHTTNERITQLFTNPQEFSHFLAENSDISADAVVAPTAKHHYNKFSDMLQNSADSAAAVAMAAAVAHREKLAQYFANNVRDGNKFTEFLMNNSNNSANGIIGGNNCDYNNTGMYGSETEQRFQIQCTDKMIQDRNSLSVTTNNSSDMQANFSQLLNQSQQYHQNNHHHQQQQQQIVHQQQQHDKDDDLDSVDTSSELSLTMSPDENQRNAGKCIKLIDF